MSKPISVYESDPFQMIVDTEPEKWSAAQRLATDEEYARILVLLEYKKELQVLLKKIRRRPDYDGLDECEDPDSNNEDETFQCGG